MSRERDFQQSKVYAAEHQLQWFYDNVPSGVVNLLGVNLVLEPETRFTNLADVQKYVDLVVLHPGVIGKFGRYGRVFVRERKTAHAAHYKAGVIAVHTKDGGRWALRETVILHELAHHYAGTSCGHGPKFTETMIDLMSIVMGPQVAQAARMLNRDGGVK